MHNLTPVHPLTHCALAQALRLADLLAPVNATQQEARQRIIQAVADGDLFAAVDAVHAACAVGRRGIATLDWREWAEGWLDKVDRLILVGATNG